MRWHDRVLGGLNIFRRSTDEVDPGDARLSQSFADVATLVVVQSTEIPADQVAARVHEAITARSQVEQAKGVLAYLRNLDMPAAYEELLQLARDRGRTLTETARDVVREQYESR
jgi:AmiR/NasT family two-component response regulator